MKRIVLALAICLLANSSYADPKQILWGYLAGPNSQIQFKFGTGLTWFTLAAPCAASRWYSTTDANGQLSCTQPSFSDIANQATLAQLPTMNAKTLLGNSTGGSATPIMIPLDSTLSFYSETTLGAAQMLAGTVKSNLTGGLAQGSDNSPSAVLDFIGSTRGSILERGVAAWTPITPEHPVYLSSPMAREPIQPIRRSISAALRLQAFSIPSMAERA